MGRVLLAGQSDAQIESYIKAEAERAGPRALRNPQHLRDELEVIRKEGCSIVEDELQEVPAGIAA